jgi:pimeloyl-ACP methyl ester carboxylesterase
MTSPAKLPLREEEVQVQADDLLLEGNLAIPSNAHGLVVFAHGSGSSRHSSRNRHVAGILNEAGLGTLLFDLLTAAEERLDSRSGHLRFDIPFLAKRVIDATDWLGKQQLTAPLRLGYFGASTGAAAALVAAASRSEVVRAVVSRGGRPDLAGDALPHVKSPTLLIVGGNDVPVIGMNQEALRRLGTPERQLIIVPGASHLFPEPGALEEVAQLAAGWLTRFLGASAPPA